MKLAEAITGESKNYVEIDVGPLPPVEHKEKEYPQIKIAKRQGGAGYYLSCWRTPYDGYGYQINGEALDAVMKKYGISLEAVAEILKAVKA